jgi:putative ABC transport system permease protein
MTSRSAAVSFVVRMAWRETRQSWGRLLFFFLCVALGVAAIVVLRSVVQNVRITLTREARFLVGTDVLVSAPRPLTEAQQRTIDQTIDANGGVTARTSIVETMTMAAAEGSPQGSNAAVRLVELRGVEPAYPFYGAVELADGRPYSHALLAGRGVLVQPEFLSALSLNVGDRVRLAGRPFTIRGVVSRDRVQRAGGGFAFGPRAYLDLAELRTLGILGVGSRATHMLALRVEPAGMEAITADLRRAFENETVGVRSWRTLEDRLGRNLSVTENYLSLVGFAVVVLGGIGVWSVTRVVVQQKIRSVAILKCLGATSGRVLAAYLLQMLWLAACGSALGVALAAVGVAAIPESLVKPLGITGVGLTLSAVLQGMSVGLLVSVLFALVPLLEIRRVKPLLLLRADTKTTARARSWQSFLAGAATVGALALVAVWQAGSLRAGLFVSGGLAAVTLVLLGVSRLLIRAAVPLTRSRRFAVRHAAISLTRPGNQTRVILMAVGIGCFFVMGMRALQANLLHEFSLQLGPSTPDLILIDVQRDQVDGVRTLTASHTNTAPQLVPLIRARVVGIQGQRTVLADADAVRKHGRLTREFGLTFRDTLEQNERVVAGAFWSSALALAPQGADTEVSISEEVVRDADVQVGDLMRFDIAGAHLSARVTSTRKVGWDETQSGGFFFVLRPAPALDRVAMSYVGFVELGGRAEARGALQRDLVKAFPNVSAIDVSALIQSIREILNNVTLGVTVVGAITLVGGVLILIGAVAMTKFQRLYEAAIYRTLGASTRRIAAMVAVEYGILGFLAGLLGAAGALGLSWVLAEFLFEMDWRPAPGILSAGLVLTSIAVMVVGLAASMDILVRKPLGTLRSE